MYTMTDTSMGAALYGTLKDHELCTTVEIKIMYFNPVMQGKVICDTKLIHKSKPMFRCDRARPHRNIGLGILLKKGIIDQFGHSCIIKPNCDCV